MNRSFLAAFPFSGLRVVITMSQSLQPHNLERWEPTQLEAPQQTGPLGKRGGETRARASTAIAWITFRRYPPVNLLVMDTTLP